MADACARRRVVDVAVGVLVDAAAAAGVQAVGDSQQVEHEEDSEDDGAVCEFHVDLPLQGGAVGCGRSYASGGAPFVTVRTGPPARLTAL